MAFEAPDSPPKVRYGEDSEKVEALEKKLRYMQLLMDQLKEDDADLQLKLQTERRTREEIVIEKDKEIGELSENMDNIMEKEKEQQSRVGSAESDKKST